jgi:hypothetical protein
MSNLDINTLLTDHNKIAYKTTDETTSEISYLNRLKSSANESDAWNMLVNNSKNTDD